MSRLSVLALVLASLLLTSPSWARGKQQKPYVDEGTRIYIGALGVASWMPRFEDEFSNSTVDTDLDSGPSYGGALVYGMRLTKPFAIELDLEWVPGVGFDQSAGLGSNSDEIDTWTLASSIAYHPLSGWFDPYIALGAGWMYVDADDLNENSSGLALRGAVGVDFWATDHLGLRLEGRYTLPVTSAIRDFDHLGPRVGFFYRF
jgi:opacity protein-like surface antigen